MPERALPQHQYHKKVFTVGIFVIGTALFLVFGILWLKNFSLGPAYAFTARFKETPYITPGSPVYFRGVKVGEVGHIQLSSDGTSSLVTLDITQKNLKLPLNTLVSIHTEGITGVVYVMLSYPFDEPPSLKTITNGLIVQGDEMLNLYRLQHRLSKVLTVQRLETLLNATSQTLSESQQTLQQVKIASQKTAAFMDSAKQVADSGQETVQDVHQSLHRIANRVKQLTQQSEITVGKANQTLQKISHAVNEDTVPLHQALVSIQRVSGSLSTLLGSPTGGSSGGLSTLVKLGTTASTPQFQSSLFQVMQNTNQALIHFDCLQSGVASLMNQRFLLFKLAFGKPGQAFAHCTPQPLLPNSLQPVSGQPPPIPLSP